MRPVSLFTDASFAPDSEKSRSGWLVLMAGSPLSWRSSRQTTVSISTAEAELGAVLEGGIALLGTAALLRDLDMDQMEKVIHVDSTSALAISEGSGSWRTRHLRVKAEWLSERLWRVRHPSLRRAGSVGGPPHFKVMTWSRIRELLLLRGFNVDADPTIVGIAKAEASKPLHNHGGSSSHTYNTDAAKPDQAARVLAVLILLSMVPKGNCTGAELWSESQPLRLDPTLLSGALMVGLILFLIVGWELLRWAGIQTYDRLGPGASVRRLHRLRRLRDTTARAIEDELRRRVDQQASSETSTAQPKRRPVEGRLSGPPRRSCTEGGSSSSSAVATLGSAIAGGELGPKLERSQFKRRWGFRIYHLHQ